MSKPSGAIDMTQGKPINLMLRFALPMMIGSIFQSLYSMVDSAVLGRFVGSHALAAIGATTSTTGLILLLATGVTSAISIVLSQYVGANDTDRVRKGIVASGWITLLLGVVNDIDYNGFQTAEGIIIRRVCNSRLRKSKGVFVTLR